MGGEWHGTHLWHGAAAHSNGATMRRPEPKSSRGVGCRALPLIQDNANHARTRFRTPERRSSTSMAAAVNANC